MKEFALYKGEDILSIGTISDIANQLEVRKETIAYYKTQAYRRKLDKRKKSDNPMILIEIEEDTMEKCFADNGRSCIVLRAKNCKDCKFFKTQKQVEEGRKKAMDRINKLDIHTKSSIINLYFQGYYNLGICCIWSDGKDLILIDKEKELSDRHLKSSMI